MKKLLLTISLFICANLMFASDITLSVGDVDVTGKVPGDKVYVSITIDYNTPGEEIGGWQLFIWHNQSIITWDGNTANPGLGTLYLNPLFPNSAAAMYNVNPGSEFVYLWGDGSAFANLNAQTFPVTIITLIFTYHGGLNPGDSSPLIWGTSGKIAGDMMEKGTTEVYTWEEFDYYNLTLNDGSVYIPGISCDPGLWTGGGDGISWFDPLNWDCGYVPNNVDITIPAAKASIVISGGTAVTAALNLMGGSLTIADDGALTTNGLFTNNGMFLIQSESIFGYAGSYIDNGGIAGGGMFEFDRIVLCSGTTGGSTNSFGWHYLAAPWEGFTSDGLFDYYVNAWNQGTGMWDRFDPFTVYGPCTQWPATPLNVLDAWSVNFASDYPDPVCIPPLPAGTGAQVEFVSGVAGVHTGAYGKVLGYGAYPYGQWNMVSNPYPSGLDVNTIAWGPNTVAAAYYYDGCAGNYVYWATGMGSYVMAPTLGFFVETVAPDAFNVTNASRAHGAHWFWKNDVANLLTLQATGTGGEDVLNVRFASDVTADFDLNGDAHKLFSETANIPQIYTFAGTEKLAINALPETALVHMGFVANGSGTYTIEAIETSEFANVVLEDGLTGIQTDLLSGSYTFNYTEGEHPFVIHFTPLGISEPTVATNIWAADQTIYVQTPATTGDIVVYNMMGQVVVSSAIQPGVVNEIPMDNVNTYYIVKVLGSEITETGKVFIK